MSELVADNLSHVLAFLLLLSRIGDVVTTYVVTPRLTLEANPVVRRLRWRFALLTLLVAGVPYLSEPAGLMMLPPFFLVSASNIGGAWVVRGIGEERYHALLLEVAGRTRLRQALLPQLAASFFIMLLAATVWIFYPDPMRDWGFWIGAGIAMYALVRLFHGTLFARRIFRKAAQAQLQPQAQQG